MVVFCFEEVATFGVLVACPARRRTANSKWPTKRWEFVAPYNSCVFPAEMRFPFCLGFVSPQINPFCEFHPENSITSLNQRMNGMKLLISSFENKTSVSLLSMGDFDLLYR